MISNTAQNYNGLISNRSRRLRTIAAVLLLFILGMAAYGTRVLVPRVNRAAAVAAKPAPQSHSASVANAASRTNEANLNLTRKEARVLRFNVLFVAAYWVVWVVLVLALLIIAWLDLREISRTYLERRRELWSAASKDAGESLPPVRSRINKKRTSNRDLEDSSGPST